MKKLKIAFIGTHGTGKTTLCYHLTAELKKQGFNATMITELARKCPFPINKDTNEKTPMWLMTAQISEELSGSHTHDIVVCDRSILDPYVYALISGVHHPLFEHLVDQWINSYDLLFKVPVNYDLVDDGVRAMDPEFQQDVDEKMNEILIKKGIRCLVLPRDDQLNFIKKKLADKAVYLPLSLPN